MLTAAHCTIELEAAGYPYGDQDLYVSFDPDPVSHPETWIRVSAIYTHPDYEANAAWMWTHTNDPHDIAILELSKRARRIEPATLPEVGFHDAVEPDLGRGASSADFLASATAGRSPSRRRP